MTVTSESFASLAFSVFLSITGAKATAGFLFILIVAEHPVSLEDTLVLVTAFGVAALVLLTFLGVEIYFALVANRDITYLFSVSSITDATVEEFS